MKILILGNRGATAALVLSLACAPAQGQSGVVQRVMLPGTGYEVILEPRTSREPTPPSPALVGAIGAWLSVAFDLRPMSRAPTFHFVAPEAMAAFRHQGIASGPGTVVTIGRSAAHASEMEDILALYDNESRTIYLREDWSGDTAAGLSIVVHEMVHHLQKLAGLRFECYEAREKQAFAAQEQWLVLFGKDLATEFGLDPLTLLVRTNCSF